CSCAPAPTSAVTRSLHDALPILKAEGHAWAAQAAGVCNTGCRHSRGEEVKRRGRFTGQAQSGQSPPSLDFYPPGMPATCVAHARSEEHTSELQSRFDLVCRLLLE